MKRLAKQNDVDIWFEDECHFLQHGTRCTMWVPPEDINPVVLQSPTRKSIAYFGAVRANDGYFVSQRANKFNAEEFGLFLRKIMRHRRNGRKILVVTDNARWHHARILASLLAQNKKILRLDFLPPYSPDINNVERVWKLTRKLCTHNQYFEKLEELIDVVEKQFQLWKKPNNSLRRLCAII